MINSFRPNFLLDRGREADAREILIFASVCNDIRLGHSKLRKGPRIGLAKANEILVLLRGTSKYGKYDFSHFAEIQLHVRDIYADRVSDI